MIILTLRLLQNDCFFYEILGIAKEPSKDAKIIEVIKDLNLENSEGNDDQGLANLELLHLAGPFGPEITSYLIKDAKFIDNLGLAINWIDSDYCSLQPRSNKDYIGKEYLKELVKVNPLSNLYQLHLSGYNEESIEKIV